MAYVKQNLADNDTFYAVNFTLLEDYVLDIQNQITNVMPEFVSSVDEMTDPLKKYVYDGNIWVYGDTASEAVNKFDPSTATINTRYGTSSMSALDGFFVTDYIPVENFATYDPYVMRAYISEGVGFDASIGNQRVHFFDSSKTLLGNKYLQASLYSSDVCYPYYDEDGIAYWHIDECWSEASSNAVMAEIPDFDHSQVAYVRITLGLNNVGTAITAEDIANVIITFDADEGAVAGFYDTGVAWSGSGSADIADFVAQINANAAAIAQLEDAIDGIQSGSGEVTVPTYWQSAVDETVEKVKAIQYDGGADVVNFCWFSDLHYIPSSAYTKNVGKLCAAMMDECDIPLTLFTGDTTAADVLASEEILLSYLDAASEMLSPIGHENLLHIRGNHDDVWGSYTSGDTTSYYVNKVSADAMWNHIHRKGAKDMRRSYGGNGTYWYVDNVPQKTRFVCLNCEYYDGEAITGGTTGAMTGGFGAEQLEWLESEALSVEDGWGVVIATHIPPTAQAINGNTYYLSQLPDGEDFRIVIQNATAEIIAVFCGHCHVDAIVEGDLPCPILTITCAVNTPYDGTASQRVANTDTETAIDVVSIDRESRTIHCTRLGCGSDREVSY